MFSLFGVGLSLLHLGDSLGRLHLEKTLCLISVGQHTQKCEGENQE